MLRWSLWQSNRNIAALLVPQLHRSNVILFFKSSLHWSSRSRPSLHNYYLRKRRQWPLSPYKTKWHQTFAHQQALQTLQKSAQTSQTHLLSALIHSFATYKCDPSPNAYHFIIKILMQNPSQGDQIPQVLDHLQKIAIFETPEHIFVDLIKFYGDRNMIQQAIALFFRIPNFRCNPSVHSLNALLSVLCKTKRGLEIVPEILMKSESMNIRIEDSSFEILIRALCRKGKVNYAVELLNYMVSEGFIVNGRTFSLVLSNTCDEKDFNGVEIMYFLEDLKKLGFTPDRGDWCNVIRFMVKRANSTDATKALNQMKAEGIEPDIVCCNWVLDRLVLEGEYVKAEELFDQMLVLGLVPDIFTYNAYIDGLCKQNKTGKGIKMLACMEELGCSPNLTTYNTILGACCGNGELNLARSIIRKMGLKGVELNSHSYEFMIIGCYNNYEISEACELLKEMVDKCSVSRSTAFDQILCGLCQRSMLDEALELLKEMVGKNVGPGVAAWEALLQGSEKKYNFEVNSIQAGSSSSHKVDNPL